MACKTSAILIYYPLVEEGAHTYRRHPTAEAYTRSKCVTFIPEAEATKWIFINSVFGTYELLVSVC